MRKFEGNINGKKYTDENEFNKAIADWDGSSDMLVCYQYCNVSDSDVKDESKSESNKDKVCSDNIVLEREYVKNVSNKNEVELDSNLVNKLKTASNKSDIYLNVCKRITDFDNKISDNLLHINELKSDYKKLDEQMNLINSQIKTLDDANNNYYLNKEYYTNIKDLIEVPVANVETKSECGCKCGGCTCTTEDKSGDVISLSDIYNMTTYELVKYLKKNKVYTLSDLVDYFIK